MNVEYKCYACVSLWYDKRRANSRQLLTFEKRVRALDEVQ